MSPPSDRGSLLSQLVTRLRAAGESLPIAETVHAGTQIDQAAGTLTSTLESSRYQGLLPELATARTHVERSLAAMTQALDALDRYLAAIGVAGTTAGEPTPGLAPARFATQRATAGAAADQPGGIAQWWAGRIAELTEAGSAAANPDRTGQAQQLLQTLVTVAGENDRDGYRRALLRADPAMGLQVPTLAMPALRHFLTEYLGRPGTGQHLSTLVNQAQPRVRELLPALDDPVLRALLGRACHAPGTATEVHPVDVAVTYPVLLAETLHRLGRDASALTTSPDGASQAQPAGRRPD